MRSADLTTHTIMAPLEQKKELGKAYAGAFFGIRINHPWIAHWTSQQVCWQGEIHLQSLFDLHRKKTTKPTVNSLRAWACSPLPDCVLFLHFQGVQLLPSIKRCGNRPISSLPCLLRHPLSGYLLVGAFTVSLHFPVSVVGWSKSLPNRLSESQDITQPWRCIV